MLKSSVAALGLCMAAAAAAQAPAREGSVVIGRMKNAVDSQIYVSVSTLPTGQRLVFLMVSDSTGIRRGSSLLSVAEAKRLQEMLQQAIHEMGPRAAGQAASTPQ